MKRYKLLKDIPGSKAGAVIKHTPGIAWSFGGFLSDDFPDFFEEIKEPSDEEVLAQFLFNNHFKPPQNEYRSILWGVLHDANKEQYFLMAKALIEKGFNVDFLRKEEL